VDRRPSRSGRSESESGGGTVVRRITPALLGLSVLLALAGACRFPGSVRSTLKIGLVAPFEGRYRYVGYDVIYAVRLALREANESGGIDGWGVELAAFDDGGDPDLAADQVRKLGVDPQVMAALGHFRGETTLAALDAYADVGLGLLAATGLDTGLDPDHDYGPFVFVLTPDAERLAIPLVGRALELAPDRQVVLATEALAGPFAEAMEAAAARQGLGLAVVRAGQEGWQQDVLGYYPEVLVCDVDPVAAGELVALLDEGGWRGEVLGGPALSAADFVAVAGKAAEGAVFLTPWPFPRDVAGGREFAEAYREVSNGSEPGPLALPAFESTRLLLDAVEVALEKGELTRSGVTGALEALEREGRLANFDVGGGGVLAQQPLDWYQIGGDGAPVLLGQEAASGIDPRALE